ncbi:MAG: NAD(P)/FAD-dependent oxidoreductase [Acholeplasmatales bacterium]|nr:NAD(P)/FAD-dependent oxidoreductase [Acholeplasmatales bacterium]
MNNRFYKDKYDVVIIGAGISGLASALSLTNKNLNILVLEQHNLPGGVATSFVRGGVEFEASLHEMMSIGSKENRLNVGEFFDLFGININWIRVPEAYRLVTDSIDVTIHAGENGNYEVPAKEIAEACGNLDGLYEKILDFFLMCKRIYDGINSTARRPIGLVRLISNYPDLIRTAGYSTYEVLKSFDLPDKTIDILSAYWMYVGNRTKDLPFTIYAFLVADYFGYGSYIPKNTSHEMSLKMAMKCEELGVEIEYDKKVEKILVKDNKIRGVRLSDGTIINCDYVISGAYPNNVYTNMIEPKIEIKPEMIKYVNSKEIGCSCFSVILLLDKDYHELGIKDYATFYAPNGMDIDKIWEEGKTLGPWNYITSVCVNVANPDASPKGTCIYSMTYLPLPDAFKSIDVKDYEEIKRKNAMHFIELESKRLGVNLLDHILELEMETPISVAHYVGSWNGSIYGFRHQMDDHIVARLGMKAKEQYISGLAFNGAHQTSGDGMAPVINSGRAGANDILMEMRARRSKNEDK